MKMDVKLLKLFYKEINKVKVLVKKINKMNKIKKMKVVNKMILMNQKMMKKIVSLHIKEGNKNKKMMNQKKMKKMKLNRGKWQKQ